MEMELCPAPYSLQGPNNHKLQWTLLATMSEHHHSLSQEDPDHSLGQEDPDIKSDNRALLVFWGAGGSFSFINHMLIQCVPSHTFLRDTWIPRLCRLFWIGKSKMNEDNLVHILSFDMGKKSAFYKGIVFKLICVSVVCLGKSLFLACNNSPCGLLVLLKIMTCPHVISDNRCTQQSENNTDGVFAVRESIYAV